METFLWNGQPCKVRFVNVKILPKEVLNMAWWKPFEGQIRRAIEVHSWGEPFIIDNEDGLGYSKITKGGGMWTSGSRHFDKDNIELVGETPENEIVKAFLKDKYDEIGSISDAYWAKEKPDEHKRLQVLKKLASSKIAIL